MNDEENVKRVNDSGKPVYMGRKLCVYLSVACVVNKYYCIYNKYSIHYL